jgi:hypothetical protein
MVAIRWNSIVPLERYKSFRVIKTLTVEKEAEGEVFHKYNLPFKATQKQFHEFCFWHFIIGIIILANIEHLRERHVAVFNDIGAGFRGPFFDKTDKVRGGGLVVHG